MSQGRLSDDRLARAAAHGEPDAFGEVFARYNGALYGYCLSILHDPEDARDALQATMEKAFAAISTQRVKGGLRAWLFGIAHNEAISLARTRQATQPYGDELALAAAAGADPAERERMTQLVSDLKTLPEQQRSALVLRELSGLGSEEIGSALGISPSAAKQAVYEARATLLAQSGGRDMDCRQVQMKLSDSDGRVRRGRRLKAHLADCALCTAFAAAIPARTADMRMVFPPLGAA
ncbi:MAG TPA: sigma-70 family RNA polymerase sigma factor, partial [Thermoleophilaceae bacterium]|nr:sigma-70 family RNA polymerase sigma factor [Thermoleophilaceae bacterium]